MPSLIIYILLVPTLVTWSANAENSGHVIGNNSLEFRTTSTDIISSLINTTGTVFHMEPDLHIYGNILFSDNYALKTTDGVATVTIAGSASSSGNLVAIGQLVRFGNITGFRQISPNYVVVVDNTNHCLRLVDRLTLQTPWYAGYCGRSGGGLGTTNARFNSPWSVIVDQRRPDMLLVSDTNNYAIKHVQVVVGSGLSEVSMFFTIWSIPYTILMNDWTFIFRPNGIAQNALNGNLYITSYTLRGVYKLDYYNLRGLTVAFEASYAAYLPYGFEAETILIDNATKLVLADKQKNQLMSLELSTRKSTLLCSGLLAHLDGDMAFCKLDRPSSLMVLNNTLYVGEYQRIRKIRDACQTQEYDPSPDTGLALVSVPNSVGTTHLHLPPGQHQITLGFASATCTVTYHVSGSWPVLSPMSTIDHRELACPITHVHTTASSDTGVAVVEIPLSTPRSGELSLPPGRHPLHISSDSFNCTVEYNIRDFQESPCTNPEIRKFFSPDTRVALVDMAMSGFQEKLSLPPGDYTFDIISGGNNCTVNIGIADHRLRRRLVFQAQYHINCETTTGNLAELASTKAMAGHAFGYSEICSTDCARPDDVDIQRTCTGNILTVVWPSNIIYMGDINSVPEELDQRLTSRIIAKGSAFYLYLLASDPWVVFPEQQDHGGYIDVQLSSFCIGESVTYVKATDMCGEQQVVTTPGMQELCCEE